MFVLKHHNEQYVLIGSTLFTLHFKGIGQIVLFVITLKRANSKGRCNYNQKARVKRRPDPFHSSPYQQDFFQFS